MWSPDGTRAILAANPVAERDWLNFELYEISLDGQVTQRTNLTTYYPTTYIQSYSWAPDGRRIAFWLNTEMQPLQDQYFGKQSLAPLNLDTGEVINHCVVGNTDTSRSQFIGAPIWSPSGEQLLIESGSFEEGTRVISVDLTRGIATQVVENMIPVGWMQAP